MPAEAALTLQGGAAVTQIEEGSALVLGSGMIETRRCIHWNSGSAPPLSPHQAARGPQAEAGAFG